MRHVSASEEEVALTVLNALDAAGFEVVVEEQHHQANVCKGSKAAAAHQRPQRVVSGH
jgi:hypothetical protein